MKHTERWIVDGNTRYYLPPYKEVVIFQGATEKDIAEFEEKHAPIKDDPEHIKTIIDATNILYPPLKFINPDPALPRLLPYSQIASLRTERPVSLSRPPSPMAIIFPD